MHGVTPVIILSAHVAFTDAELYLFSYKLFNNNSNLFTGKLLVAFSYPIREFGDAVAMLLDFERPFVKRFALCYRSVVYLSDSLLSCPVCL